MKKISYAKIGALLLLTLISSSLLSQSILSREALDIKGPVKLHTWIDPEGNHEHYYFDQDGNLTRFWFEGSSYYNNSELPVDFTYKYNEQGKLVRIDKSVGGSRTFPYVVLGYNSEGELLSMVEYDSFYDGDIPEKYIVTLYDSSGRELAIDRFKYGNDEPISKKRFVYDVNGRLDSQIFRCLLGDDISFNKAYFYDDSDRVIRIETETDEDFSCVTYLYNKKGLLIEESLSSDGPIKIESVTYYEYNKSDLLSKKREIYDGNWTSDCIYSYEYNESNQLVNVMSNSMTEEGEDECLSESYTYDDYGNYLSDYDGLHEVLHIYEYYR